MLEALLARFQNADRLALSRLLSHAARGEHLHEIEQFLAGASHDSRVVAITGGPGVGKSTLVGKLLARLRESGQSVAVLACDPESPLSGGALLGDRFRMPALPEDEGVFIRSLATASGQGAVAEHVDLMLRLLAAFGFQTVLIETVGAGQGDTAVHDLCDVVVLLLQPEMGDDLQWEKAGIFEIADVIVIHKADLPGADQTEQQVRAALSLSSESTTPILRVSSKTEEGIPQFLEALDGMQSHHAYDRIREDELLRVARKTLSSWYARAVAAHDPMLKQLIDQWRKGDISSTDAGVALWHLLEMIYGAESV